MQLSPELYHKTENTGDRFTRIKRDRLEAIILLHISVANSQQGDTTELDYGIEIAYSFSVI